MLTTRPIMLHMAQLLLSGHTVTWSDDDSSLTRLARTCTEAARRLLQTMALLREKNLIAIFGFFDCDAIFSAAFVMILAEILDSVCEIGQKVQPSPGLGEALALLRYMAAHRSANAVRRLADVEAVWSTVTAHFQIEPVAVSHSTHAASPPRLAEEQEPVDGRLTMGLAEVQNTAAANMRDTCMPDFWEAMPHLFSASPNDLRRNTVGSCDTSLPAVEDFGALVDEDWQLTGVDSRDFAELERHVMEFMSTSQ
ncbi:hypothetical protein CC79DRAFT_820698 [Sarocladium strictum]